VRRPRPGVVVLLVVVIAGAVAIAVGPGWRGLAIYGFFVALAALLAFGTGIAGDVVSGASRGRFRHEDRH
jgi:hypothetical protein